jgi:hypothetical protein
MSESRNSAALDSAVWLTAEKQGQGEGQAGTASQYHLCPVYGNPPLNSNFQFKADLFVLLFIPRSDFPLQINLFT